MEVANTTNKSIIINTSNNSEIVNQKMFQNKMSKKSKHEYFTVNLQFKNGKKKRSVGICVVCVCIIIWNLVVHSSMVWVWVALHKCVCVKHKRVLKREKLKAIDSFVSSDQESEYEKIFRE